MPKGAPWPGSANEVSSWRDIRGRPRPQLCRQPAPTRWTWAPSSVWCPMARENPARRRST
ncbi:hypothetical protein ACFFX0_21220 [Citricoccus parietis]|uniref:Uncharacterized protein n=1 Tax=Citricoccus parietis TaxID=592307 RepID=A0ABV5G4K9_9MICC